MHIHMTPPTVGLLAGAGPLREQSPGARSRGVLLGGGYWCMRVARSTPRCRLAGLRLVPSPGTIQVPR